MRILGILILLLSALGAGYIGGRLDHDKVTTTAATESAFQRVLRTGVIRCGYYVYPPVTYRDPNTNQMSGFSVDMMDKIAAKAGLKVEWTDEVTFGNWAQEMDAGRFDVACTPQWPVTALGKQVIFSKPMMYSQIHALGRAGETRFNSLADLNKPEVKITVADANETYYLAKELLPNATILTQAQNADGQQVILDVISGKADAFISDRNALEQWNKANTQKIQVIAGGETLKAMPFTFAVNASEQQLNNFLNNALDDLNNTSAIARLLDKWMPFKGVFSLVAEPYQDK